MHFWQVVTRFFGGVTSPVKYFFIGAIPELISSRLLSPWGISEKLPSRRCSFDSKNSRNFSLVHLVPSTASLFNLFLFVHTSLKSGVQYLLSLKKHPKPFLLQGSSEISGILISDTRFLLCGIRPQQLQGVFHAVHVRALIAVGSIHARTDEAVAHIVARPQGGLGIAAVVGIYVYSVGGPGLFAASTRAVVTT